MARPRTVIAVAMALCLVIVVLGVVSLKWAYGYLGHRWTIGCSQGALYVDVHTPLEKTGWYSHAYPWWAKPRLWPVFQRYWADTSGRFLRFPLWPLVALLLVICGCSYWRNRRPEKNACVDCGYDLTGNESGVCPECGAPTDV
jgi:hypothetical protein